MSSVGKSLPNTEQQALEVAVYMLETLAAYVENEEHKRDMEDYYFPRESWLKNIQMYLQRCGNAKLNEKYGFSPDSELYAIVQKLKADVAEVSKDDKSLEHCRVRMFSAINYLFGVYEYLKTVDMSKDSAAMDAMEKFGAIVEKVKKNLPALSTTPVLNAVQYFHREFYLDLEKPLNSINKQINQYLRVYPKEDAWGCFVGYVPYGPDNLISHQIDHLTKEHYFFAGRRFLVEDRFIKDHTNLFAQYSVPALLDLHLTYALHGTSGPISLYKQNEDAFNARCQYICDSVSPDFKDKVHAEQAKAVKGLTTMHAREIDVTNNRIYRLIYEALYGNEAWNQLLERHYYDKQK